MGVVDGGVYWFSTWMFEDAVSAWTRVDGTIPVEIMGGCTCRFDTLMFAGV